MKKRKWMLGSAMLLVVILVAGGTLAWFTATADPVVNEFTAGTLEIELIDEFDGAPNVNPGDCYDKEVYVRNLGTKRAFIRIEKNIAFEPELDLDVVEYELGAGWVEYNGYFYYTLEVAAEGGETGPLFVDNQICFNGEGMDNDYQGAVLEITIAAEAIQVTNGAALAQWGIDPTTLN